MRGCVRLCAGLLASFGQGELLYMWRMPDWLAFFRGKVSDCVCVGERRDVLAGYGIAGELLGLITCGCTYVYFR